MLLKQLSFPCQVLLEKDMSRLWPLGVISGGVWGKIAAAPPVLMGRSWGLRCAETVPISLAHKAICTAEWINSRREDSKLSHPGSPPASPSVPIMCTLHFWASVELLLTGTKPRYKLSGVPTPLWSVPIWFVRNKITLWYYSKNVPSALKPVVTGGLMLAKSWTVHTQNYGSNISEQRPCTLNNMSRENLSAENKKN